MHFKLKVICTIPMLKPKSKNKTFGIPKVAIPKSKSNFGKMLKNQN